MAHVPHSCGCILRASAGCSRPGALGSKSFFIPCLGETSTGTGTAEDMPWFRLWPQVRLDQATCCSMSSSSVSPELPLLY